MRTNKKLERKRVDKISDRFDIRVEIEPVEFDDMANRALDRPQTFGVAF